MLTLPFQPITQSILLLDDLICNPEHRLLRRLKTVDLTARSNILRVQNKQFAKFIAELLFLQQNQNAFMFRIRQQPTSNTQSQDGRLWLLDPKAVQFSSELDNCQQKQQQYVDFARDNLIVLKSMNSLFDTICLKQKCETDISQLIQQFVTIRKSGLRINNQPVQTCEHHNEMYVSLEFIVCLQIVQNIANLSLGGQQDDYIKSRVRVDKHQIREFMQKINFQKLLQKYQAELLRKPRRKCSFEQIQDLKNQIVYIDQSFDLEFNRISFLQLDEQIHVMKSLIYFQLISRKMLLKQSITCEPNVLKINPTEPKLKSKQNIDRKSQNKSSKHKCNIILVIKKKTGDRLESILTEKKQNKDKRYFVEKTVKISQQLRKRPSLVTQINIIQNQSVITAYNSIVEKSAKTLPLRFIVLEKLRFLFLSSRIPHQLFGSCATDLMLENSDIDILIPLTINEQDINEVKRTKTRHLQYVLNSAINSGWCQKFELLKHASFPVLKLQIIPAKVFPTQYHWYFQDSTQFKNFSIKIDVTVSQITHVNNNVFNGNTSNIVKIFLLKYPCMKVINLICKQILVDCGLNLCYKGGMSSYCLSLIIIAYLEEMFKKNVYIDQPGKAFYGFVEYLVTFDVAKYGIDLSANNYEYPLYEHREELNTMIKVKDPYSGQSINENCFRFKEIIEEFKKVDQRKIKLEEQFFSEYTNRAHEQLIKILAD